MDSPEKCPSCGSANCPTYSVAPVEDGVRVQYRKCKDCGETFKTPKEV